MLLLILILTLMLLLIRILSLGAHRRLPRDPRQEGRGGGPDAGGEVLYYAKEYYSMLYDTITNILYHNLMYAILCYTKCTIYTYVYTFTYIHT